MSDLYGPSDRTESIATIHEALDAGVTLLDTGDFYGMGQNEMLLREALKGGKRERAFIAVKYGSMRGPDLRILGDDGRPNATKNYLAYSLRRLGTDYVDLYQLHADDRETPLDETLEALDTIVRSGRARYIGVSNFLAYRLARALGRADMLRLARFVSVQPRYNLLFRQIERELLPLAEEEGLGVIPYNPLAGGLLTGKHKRNGAPPDGRFTLGAAGKMYQERYWHEREFDTVEAFEKATREANLSPVTAAVAWVLANPVVTSAIIGASRPDQLNDSLAAADLRLDSAFKAKLDELSHEYRFGDALR
jgi:1-deoxyxylulose-5-phosphate synthase